MDQYKNEGLVETEPNLTKAVDNTFAEAVAKATPPAKK